MVVVQHQEEEAQEPIRVLVEEEQGPTAPTIHLTPVTQPLHLPPSPPARNPPCTRAANLPDQLQEATRPPLLRRDREAMATDKALARAKRTTAPPLEEHRGATLTTVLPTPARSQGEPERRTTVMRDTVASQVTVDRADRVTVLTHLLTTTLWATAEETPT